MNEIIKTIKNHPQKVELAALTVLVLLSILVLPFAASVTHTSVYTAAFCFAIVAVICYVFWKRKSVFGKPEVLTVAIILSAGLLHAFFSPASLKSWDEQHHFRRAVAVSRFGSHEMTPAEDMVSYIKLERLHNPNYGDPETMDSLADTWQQLNEADSQEKVDGGPVGISAYMAISYLPMAIGLLMGRILQLPFHDVYLLGRAANLLFYALVVYYAIRICPVGKRIMGVVALFPTSIFMAASYAYDTWVTALTMLWLAMLVDELVHTERKITRSRMVVMLGVFFLACAAKEVYCCTGLLFLLLPREKFASDKTKRNFWIAVLVCMAVIVVHFMMPLVVKSDAATDHRGGDDVNAVAQVKFILTEPLAYTRILLRFLSEYLSLNFSSGYTSFLAYLGYGTQIMLQFLLLAVVTATDRNSANSKVVDSAFRRIFVMLTLFGTVCVITSALYIAFTPVRLETINGVQARYLTPLVFPFLLFLGTGKMENKIKPEVYNLMVFGTGFYIVFRTFWDCVYKYF